MDPLVFHVLRNLETARDPYWAVPSHFFWSLIGPHPLVKTYGSSQGRISSTILIPDDSDCPVNLPLTRR